MTLDRFDPGRDQAGASGRVPSALLPGDVLVPCLFSTQTETTSGAVIQSEAELHHCFKVSLTLLGFFFSRVQNLVLRVFHEHSWTLFFRSETASDSLVSLFELLNEAQRTS